ncbi:MAG TPA: ornithine carbamoyltransferase [Bacteroidota bacterium]|nr:ornithine carbamoyltransferase [Bacteroidota bacterium]
MKKDLVSFALWNTKDLSAVFTLARRLKNGDLRGSPLLERKSVAMIFEKESLRTRVAFEVGIAQLGGHPIFLQQETIGMATRESVHDIGVVLSRYNELIVARTSRHQTCVQLAESATVPVINAMTDLLHPCQILADIFTLQEAGRFGPAQKLLYIGDGNNVANSLLEIAEKLSFRLVLCCPPGFEPHPQILEQAKAGAVGSVELTRDPAVAVKDADVVYTDVWPQTEAGGSRLAHVFKPYQVNKTLLKEAKKDCLVMHRLPANRGEEITTDVLDGKHSIALTQAENRLHVHKGVIAFLLGAA